MAVPTSGIAVIALSAGVLWLLCAFVTARDEVALERLDRWLLALALLVLASYSAAQLNGTPGFTTDEAAFEQQAAQLLLHGHDPYGANLLTSLSAFSVPSKYATYTTSGGMVSTLGYPALPVLIGSVFVKLTGGGQAVPIATVIALMVATVAMFRSLPSGWRGIAVIICVGFPALSEFALAGMNTIIMMAALVVVATRWSGIGEHGVLNRGDRLRALAFGLALSSNQLSWFIAPFLLLAIFLVRSGHLGHRRAAKLTAGFLALAAATFIVVNAPFIVWGPAAWLQGVLAPLTQHAIPYGQGIVGLALFLRVGGGALDGFSYAAGCTYIALLIVYGAYFRRLARCCFVLPTIALFISGRSLAGYWMMLIAVIVVSVLTSDDGAIHLAARIRPPRSWRWSRSAGKLVVPGLFVPAGIYLAIALGTPQPLNMRVLSATSESSLRSVWQLRIAVHNDSDQFLRPHFATNSAGQATAFWKVRSGPSGLAPHAAARYLLAAPDDGSVQPNGTPFLVVAVTDSPRTISSSAAFTQPGLVPGGW